MEGFDLRIVDRKRDQYQVEVAVSEVARRSIRPRSS
jgi:hypothetical protein